jgi:hypothetical protein
LPPAKAELASCLKIPPQPPRSWSKTAILVETRSPCKQEKAKKKKQKAKSKKSKKKAKAKAKAKAKTLKTNSTQLQS